jgi:predicted aspartyl protease
VTLSAYLTKRGYQRVPLSRSLVGHFQAVGSLDGAPVAVLIDTGAASTVVDLAFARDAGISCNRVETKGGGAGGANLDIFHLPDATLMLGDIKPRVTALYAMDLSHVNQALRDKGEEKVDVILGADVLESQAAVIDYASSSLFLKT